VSAVLSKKAVLPKPSSGRCLNRVPPCTHLYKYRLVYIVDGRRAVEFDNERGKGDHYHVDEEEFAYVFTGIAQLLMDFDMEVARYGNGYCDS